MKHGNWIPLCKGVSKLFPKDRQYSKIEALVSMQIDYDNDNEVTVSGYADLWRWSRNRVKRFFQEVGIKIIYPENTQKERNQKGHITIHKTTHIRFIDNKGLQDQRDIKRYIKRTTTSNTKTKTKDICPHKNILDLYHDTLPELPKIKTWSESRRSALAARWKEATSNNNGLKSNSIEYWKGFFEYIRQSDFLMGRTKNNDWKPNLEWIIKKANFIKIHEGVYHNK